VSTPTAQGACLRCITRLQPLPVFALPSWFANAACCWCVCSCSNDGAGRDESPHLYVNPADIAVGSTVDVYGRPLRVRAADPWTRAWYASTDAAAEYGVGPQPPNVVEVDVPVARAAYVPPPHTGFGSEEDSLASCLTIDVKPRRKDCTQWATWDGVVHRITAGEDPASDHFAWDG